MRTDPYLEAALGSSEDPYLVAARGPAKKPVKATTRPAKPEYIDKPGTTPLNPGGGPGYRSQVNRGLGAEPGSPEYMRAMEANRALVGARKAPAVVAREQEEARKRGTVAGINENLKRNIEDPIRKAIAPTIDVLSALNPLNPVLTPEQKKKTNAAATDLAAGAIATPFSIASEFAVLEAPNVSPMQKVGAGANIALSLIPAEEFIGGALIKGTKKVLSAGKEMQLAGQLQKGLARQGVKLSTDEARAMIRSAKDVVESKKPIKPPVVEVKPKAPETVVSKQGGFTTERRAPKPIKPPDASVRPDVDPEGALRRTYEHLRNKRPAGGYTHPELEARYQKFHKEFTGEAPPVKPIADEPTAKVAQPPAPDAQLVTPKPARATGLANQVQARETEILGTIDAAKGKSAADWQRIGKEKLDTDPAIDYEGIAERVARGDEQLTGEKVGILLEGKRQLLTDVNKAAKLLDLDPGDAGLLARYNDAKERLNTFAQNVQAGKGQWSDVGRALQAGTDLDTGDFASVLQEAKRGGQVSARLEGQLRNLTKQVSDRDVKIASLEKKLESAKLTRPTAREARTVTRQQLAEERKAIHKELDDLLKNTFVANDVANIVYNAAKMAKPAAKLAINYMKELGITLEEVATRVVKDFADRGVTVSRDEVLEAVASHNKQGPRLRDEIAKQMDELRRQARRESPSGKAKIQGEIAKLKQELQSGNFTVKDKKELTLSKELEDLRAEKQIWAQRVKGVIRANQTPATEKVLRGATGVVRGLKLGSDIGATMRQGLFGLGEMRAYGKSLKEAAQTVFSEKNFAKWEMASEERRIDGRLMEPIRQKAGLSRTQKGGLNAEEVGIGRWLSKIPVVGGAFDRWQHTLINTFRNEVFDASYLKGMSDVELKQRARFINNVTGRGNLKNVHYAWEVVMTSPRYEASRWGTLGEVVRNPLSLVKDGKLNKASVANIKTVGQTAFSLYALAKAAETQGYVVDWSPRNKDGTPNSDFLKMRRYKGGQVHWGVTGPRYEGGEPTDEVWDITAGLGTRARDVFSAIFALGGPKREGDIFTVGKKAIGRTISPGVTVPVEQGSLAYQHWVEGKAWDKTKSPMDGFVPDGEERGWWAIAPLLWSSFYKAGKDGNTEGFEYDKAFWAGAREFLGTSVQNYPKKN